MDLPFTPLGTNNIYIYVLIRIRSNEIASQNATNQYGGYSTVCVFTVAGLSTGRNFNLQNNLGYTVWVGILGNPGKGQPNNGGFALKSGERVSKGQESCGCGTWFANVKKLH